MKSWIARQRYLIDYTLAALARRRFRNAILFAVYTALVFVLTSVMLFTDLLRHEAAHRFSGFSARIVISTTQTWCSLLAEAVFRTAFY
jgi:hypothetical protein